MPYGFLDVAITPSVRAVQEEMGVDHLWSDFKGHRTSDRFTGHEEEFLAARDSFYISSISESGWPYVQHRGGPPGFLKLIDDRTLAFADYRGNRQYISTGNIAANDRVCLILIDYPRRSRLKIYAHAEILPLNADPMLRDRVTDVQYRASLERIYRLRLVAFDWNCPQHITPRFTVSEVDAIVAPLRTRLAELEATNAALLNKD